MTFHSRPPIAVITGASAGVGRATAREFAARGCDVALLARNAARLEAAAEEVRGHGVRALPIVADVADAGGDRTAAERIEAEFGPIDIWVNNAMATIFAPFQQISAEEFRRATEVTYLGQVHGTMAALAPHAATRPWHDRQCRFGTGLSRDPAAVGLLRGEICGARLHRCAAHRTHSRQKRDPRS